MLKQRAAGFEVLDRPEISEEIAEASYRFMARVNRWLGGVRVVRRFIEQEAADVRSSHFSVVPEGTLKCELRTETGVSDGRPIGPTLRVLDIGTGAGDIPIAATRALRQRGIAVEFTCLEPSPRAAAIARRNLEHSGERAIRLLEEDVWTHIPGGTSLGEGALDAYDLAVGSMFFHHLHDDEIPPLIERLRPIVRRAVLINDLRRSALHWLGAHALAALAPRDVRHDALLSIRRGFRAPELKRLLDRVPAATAAARNAWLCRVEGIVRFDRRRS
jgi:SAM-dependent methyltransferase